ncbi:hypothetical protein [Clavibacter michiganensis]|uniref:hypothetical protein n=1 Tax=Clavibacter michiganensis TaxID=28447 RepID=UPI00345B6E3D
MFDHDFTEKELKAFDDGREVGYNERQPEVEYYRDLADRYYRAWCGDDLYLDRFRTGETRDELEEHRQPKDVPTVTVEDARRSWNPDSVADAAAPDSSPTAPSGATLTNRSRTMSHISLSGNLAFPPTLREGATGPYAYAKVKVSDRIKEGDTYVDGPTMTYDLVVTGARARALVATAEACGNIRVTFSGTYTVSLYKGEIQHRVRVEEIGASFQNQAITVERRAASTKTGEE